MFTQPVSSRGKMETQASWFRGHADKTFVMVVPYLNLLWFVMHTQPVLQMSWAGSQYGLLPAAAIKLREKRACARSRAAMTVEP